MTKSPRWYASGDLNAFFGLTLDNMTQLVVLAGILMGIFGYPWDIVMGKMIPGTAVGVLLGDLIYTGMAIRLMRRQNREDVCAMPLGIDTPTLFGISFGVLGPLYLECKDATLAWQVGMALLVVMGVIKIAASFAGPAIRRLIPRPGLLGALGGIGILLIAFIPALKVFASPVVGFLSLAVILLAFLTRARMPFAIPGALLALVAGTGLWYLLSALGFIPPRAAGSHAWIVAVPWPSLGFLTGLPLALKYLPLAIPFALVDVIGGVDNTESAAAAGDDYHTRDILLAEGFSTLLAGFCGGVIQTTPYIGHPAYKRMGGRAGYTLATALFVGLGGILGYHAVFIDWIPEAVIGPILIFIGIEIGGQAFTANAPRHAPAVALAFLPIVADLLLIEINQFIAAAGGSPLKLAGDSAAAYHAILILANGFIFSSLLWGGIVAEMIDGRLRRAAFLAAVAGCCAIFGVIHSPLPGGDLLLPWRTASPVPYTFFAAYTILAGLLCFWPTKISEGEKKAS